MVPRVIFFIFEEMERRKAGYEIQIKTTYIELYNEQIIDLLDE